MRRIRLAVFLTLCAGMCVAFALGRVHAEDRAAMRDAMRQAPSAVPTLQVYSRETVVDVTVTDKDGKPVHGLSQADFTVKEDGKEQPIRSFAEFGTAATAATAPPKLPPHVYTNLQPPPASGALNILLLDFVNTAPQLAADCCQIIPCPQDLKQEQCSSPTAGPRAMALATAAQRRVKLDATKYLQQMPGGTRVEVIGMWWPGMLRVLQGFTSDPALLSAAVNTMNYDTNSIVGSGSFGNLREQFNAQEDGRSRMTLEVLQQIAADLIGVKGRKNLIWFTVGNPRITGSNAGAYSADRTRTNSLLLAAQAALYPIDARGVTTMPDDLITGSGDLLLNVPTMPGSMRADAIVQFAEKTAAEHLSMEDWAEKTGGAAFYNTNDLAGSLAKAVDKGANYYTLSYIPPGSEYDGRHHSIKVVVADQPGLKLNYRDEYYAEDPRTMAKAPGLSLAEVADSTAAVDMRTEMGRSMPTSQGVLFDVQVEPSTETVKPGDPAVFGVLDVKLKAKPLARYGFTYAFPGREIVLKPADDGRQHGSLEFDLAAYDGDGNVVTSMRQAIELNLTAEQAAQLAHSPFRYFQQLDLPAGALFVRVGVLDRTANKVGTVEIPVTVAKPVHTAAQ